MERSTIVRVHNGLHARPATRFIKLAKSFESDVELVKGNKVVSGKSPVKLMLLSVKENEELTVRTSGADAIEALEALIGFLENPDAGMSEDQPHAPEDAHGGEERQETEHRMPEPVAVGTLHGIAASEGVAVGPVFAYFPREMRAVYRRVPADAIEAEVERFHQAVKTVQQRMESSLSQNDLSANERGIIAALSDIAGDDAMNTEIVEAIREGQDALDAVLVVSARTATSFGLVDDAYLNARADDVKAVARQICLALLGETDPDLADIPAGSILVASDIGAWELARAPLKKVAAVVCGHGGATSHVAIIARTHGIPCILGMGETVEQLRVAREAAVDATRGYVFPDPDADIRQRFEARIAELSREKESLKAFRDVQPQRADGKIIEVAANLGSLEEIDAAREAGAMGVGLFRTELLFMRHATLPSEDMQFEVYSALATAFAPHAVIVRTLDIGGDKPISGIRFPEEQNPFLGWRGLRMCLDRPEIFKPQLRALLRAAVNGKIKVMLPMVSDITEVRKTRELIAECKRELEEQGRPFADFELGVMIETPAAVLIAPQLAREVAFFSIGTNDLTQYIMAADRLNPAVAALNDVRNPAVMAAIAMTAKAGTEAGIMVGMCGEAAGRPDLVEEFIRLGLTELSMSPASIPRVKKTIADMKSAS